MTQILNLPVYTLAIESRSNEDGRAAFSFYFDDDDSTDYGQVPIDLTGIEFKLQVRRNAPDQGVVLEASSENGRVAIAGDDHNFLSIIIDDSVMVKVPVGEYLFDLRATADNVTTVVLKGTWDHVMGITRS